MDGPRRLLQRLTFLECNWIFTRHPMKSLIFAAGLIAIASVAHATPITLNFEGIAPQVYGQHILINGYYNGGTASNGNSGTNYGVEFVGETLLLCLNTIGVECSNTSKGGGGLAGSDTGAMYFVQDNPIMNVFSGFDTGFSFAYSNPFAAQVGVEIWDGLNATGSLLARILSLPGTTDGADGTCRAYGSADFCPFFDASIGFAGLAKSVRFTGMTNLSTYDDLTFGSTTIGDDGDVPEPSSLALVGVALLGAAVAYRRSTRPTWKPECHRSTP
jgi:hypothetical protein